MKSSRLPGKALLDICGKSLIQRLLDRICEVVANEKVVVCTTFSPSDDLIEKSALEYGVHCYRGEELDVMGRFLSAAEKFSAKDIVRVTGDNPFTDPYLISNLVEKHLLSSAEYTFTTDLPIGTRSEVINVSALKRIHSQIVDPQSSEYMTYMLNRPDKLKTLEVKETNSKLVRPELSLTVDTNKDIELVRQIYQHFNSVIPSLEAVIAWLDAAPEINASVGRNQLEMPAHINCSYFGDALSVDG